MLFFFFFQAEDGIRDDLVTGVQTCALPILLQRGAEDRWLAGTVRLALEFAAALGVSVLVISLVYAFHIWNYPAEQHVQDMIDVLSAQRTTVYPQFAWLPALARWTVFRPLAPYLFGVVWQGYRV